MSRHDDAFLRQERDRLRAYRATAQGKAAARRYRQSPTGRATNRRHRDTAGAKAVKARGNARKIYLGRAYHSTAATVELARQINGHIQRRLHEHRQRQSGGEEAKSVSTGAVRPETTV
jgi:hypothetical protein